MSEPGLVNRLKALQAVLSQARDVICKVYGLSKEEAFERTQAFIRENSESWWSPEPRINYRDPFCQMAYLYMNVPVHASLVELAIGSFPQIEQVIRTKLNTGAELRICALGGGPGSELLGVVRFIQSLGLKDSKAYLDFVLVDQVNEWDESWHALKTGIDDQLRVEYGPNRNEWPISISRSFLALDVTAVADFEYFATRFSGIDFFILCYLVSELPTKRCELEQVLNLLVTRSSSDAMVLFIDRNEKQVREEIRQIIADNESLSLLGTLETRGRLEDNLEDLGEWYIHIPSLPRQRWLAFFALAQK